MDPIAVLTAASCLAASVLLVVFWKRIAKAYLDVLAGGDTARYDGRDMDRVLEEAEARIREVLR